ncbi:uncharacterized protein JN550_008975 [Neoarthrinium moseri]|uniref:uncharacterized protein n=1 Tax=Neoarthrinium moseri TaxID=1658444 RepID=UPI001FDE1B0E|nr:uncharacterized protein JN550_008975 [Neoarthrinium moseri]KAI1864418.1 hypothetical protein JN550_008975 [Neoarthrinium moseri]
MSPGTIAAATLAIFIFALLVAYSLWIWRHRSASAYHETAALGHRYEAYAVQGDTKPPPVVIVQKPPEIVVADAHTSIRRIETGIRAPARLPKFVEDLPEVQNREEMERITRQTQAGPA